MATLTINIGPITGDTATAVSVVTLQRSDNQQTPSGVTLPLPLSLTNGLWSGSFTDNSPAPYYNYSFDITWSDGSATGPYPGTLYSTSLSGYYTTQLAGQQIFGIQNIIKWSNKDNTSAAAADPAAIQDALNRTDREFDRMFRAYSYATPLAATLADFATISDLAAEYFGVLLYEARGLRDLVAKSNVTPADWDGKMEGHRLHVMGDIDQGGKALGELRRLCINGIAGATRLHGPQSNAPFVQMPPGVPVGAYDQSNSPATWPAQVPNTLGG